MPEYYELAEMDEVWNQEMDDYILTMARELYLYDDQIFDFFNTVEESQNG